MQPDSAHDKAVFSSDGYAMDQTRAQHLPYGRFGSHYNGCGWMAAYNMLRAVGVLVSAQAVREQLARGLWLGGQLGTGPLRLARYLRAQGAQVHTTMQRTAAYRRAQDTACRAGAVLYWNGNGAHYVAFTAESAPLHPSAKSDTEQGFLPREVATAKSDNGATREKSDTAAQGLRVPMGSRLSTTHSRAEGQADRAARQCPRRFRFFNALPGAENDVQSLPHFCAQHCAHGFVFFYILQ